MVCFSSIKLFLLLLSIFSFSNEIFEIDKKSLKPNVENKLNGVFKLSDSKLGYVIQNENLYEGNSKNVVYKRKKIPTECQNISFNILSLSSEKYIIACGEYLLYFADADYNPIGEPLMRYDILKTVVGNTVIEFYDNKLFFMFGSVINESGVFTGFISIFDVDVSENEFYQIGETFPALSYKSSIGNFHFSSCNFFDYGETIICCILLEDKTIEIGNIEDNYGFLNTEVYPLKGEELKMIKFNENLFCLIYYDSSSKTSLSFFKVSEQHPEEISSFSMKFQTTPDSFNVAKKDDQTIFITEIDQNSIIVNMISFFSRNEIKRSTFEISNIYATEIRIAALNQFNLGILYKSKAKSVGTILVNIPDCKEVTLHLYSREITVIQKNLLSENYEYLRPVDIFVQEGQAIITKNEEIHYTAVDSGNIKLYYSLADIKNEAIKSRTCRINIKICNKACSKCKRYSNNNNNPLCESCAENFFPLVDVKSICLPRYQDFGGYTFSKEAKQFIKCYETCASCEKPGTPERHECTSCIADYYEFDPETKNCNCNPLKHTWYRGSNDQVICTEYCPTDGPNLPYLNTETHECVKECDSSSEYNKKYFFSCVKTCPEWTVEEDNVCNIKSTASLIENLPYVIMELYRYLPSYSFTDSKYEIYKLFDSEVENNDIFKNISSIDMEKCKETIFQRYGLIVLIVFKIDIFFPDQIASQVEYEFFTIDGLQINKDFCKETNITIFNPIFPGSYNEINLELSKDLSEEGYDIYNPNDSFYNDVCSTYSTKNKTNVLLEDRKKFIFKNISFCEAGCQYKGFNFSANSVICECGVKMDITAEERSFHGIEGNWDFFKVSKQDNIKAFKCYKVLFSEKLVKNPGFYFGLIIFLAEIAVFVLSIWIGIKPIRDALDNIITKKYSLQSPPELTQNQTFSKLPLNSKSPERNSLRIVNAKPAPMIQEEQGKQSCKSKNYIKKVKFTKPTEISKCNPDSKKGNKTQQFEDLSTNDITKTPYKLSLFNHFSSDNLPSLANYSNLYNLQLSRLKSPSIEEKCIELRFFKKHTSNDSGIYTKKESSIISEENLPKNVSVITQKNYSTEYYTNDELNVINFEGSINYDKRKFYKYFWDVFKYNHPIVLTFFNKNDFNLKAIKISIFLFSILIDLGGCALLYTDPVISHYFHTKGKIDFVYNVQKCIFSSLITTFITVLLKLLVISHYDILRIKIERDCSRAKIMSKLYIKCLLVKLILFFIIMFSLLILLWYFISAFCSVFVSINKNLFVDTFTSFLFRLIYPFIFCFWATYFRFLSIKEKSKVLFKISKLFQVI